MANRQALILDDSTKQAGNISKRVMYQRSASELCFMFIRDIASLSTCQVEASEKQGRSDRLTRLDGRPGETEDPRNSI